MNCTKNLMKFQRFDLGTTSPIWVFTNYYGLADAICSCLLTRLLAKVLGSDIGGSNTSKRASSNVVLSYSSVEIWDERAATIKVFYFEQVISGAPTEASSLAGIFAMAYSASAEIVKLGLTPGLAGMMDPSTT